jgi:hypothetical protein
VTPLAVLDAVGADEVVDEVVDAADVVLTAATPLEEVARIATEVELELNVQADFLDEAAAELEAATGDTVAVWTTTMELPDSDATELLATEVATTPGDVVGMVTDAADVVLTASTPSDEVARIAIEVELDSTGAEATEAEEAIATDDVLVAEEATVAEDATGTEESTGAEKVELIAPTLMLE